jgi:hypothetical protein
VAEKRLDAGLSCEQRARAAAVVIAAWEARLATQTGALAVPPVAPPAPPVPPPGPSPTVIREQPQAAPEPIVVEPGIGLGASINGTTTAPAATVDVAFSRPDGLLVPAVAALIVGTHSKSVGPGDGSWRRYGLLATVGSRRTWSATWLDARVGVAATLLDISGSSFQTNHGGVTFDPGIPIGARFGLRTRPVRWWIDATVAFWPRAQTLTVMGVAASTTLPRAEALLGVGASYGGR